jgi:flagellar hook-associated protein 1 FlgK
MIRFQRAYQAAARLLTVLDENLNTLINNMGLVGR